MKSWLKHFFVVIYFALITGLYSYPLIPNITTHSPYGYEGPADIFFAIWNIMSNIKNIENGDFFSTRGNIFIPFYPEENVLVLNDRSPFNAILGRVITEFTENRALLFNLIFFLIYILSGYGMFLLSYEITGRTLPSLISATAVDFVGFYTYPQNLYANSWQFSFFSIYFLYRYFKNERSRDCFLSGLFYILTCLSTMYIGTMLTYLLAFFFLFSIYNYSSNRKMKFIVIFFGTFLVSGVIIAFFWFPYHYTYRMISHVVSMIDKLNYSYSFLSFFSIKKETSLFWWKITGGVLSGRSEWENFYGFTISFFGYYYMIKRFGGAYFKREHVPVLVYWCDIFAGTIVAFSIFLILFDPGKILTVYPVKTGINLNALINYALLVSFFYFMLSAVLIKGRRRIIQNKLRELQPVERFFIYTLVISFILSLGPLGGLFVIFNQILPGISGIRAPHRLFRMGLIACGILSAISIKDMILRVKKNWISILILLFTIIEYYNYPMNLYKLRMGDEIPAVYRWLGKQERDLLVIEYPLQKPDSFYRNIGEKRKDIILTTEYMYYSTVHNKKLVNGYSSLIPRGYSNLLEMMVDFPDKNLITLLKKLGVNYIIIHKAHLSRSELERIENKLKSIISSERMIYFDDAIVIDIDEI